MRTDGDPLLLAGAIRRDLAALDKDLPPAAVQSTDALAALAVAGVYAQLIVRQGLPSSLVGDGAWARRCGGTRAAARRWCLRGAPPRPIRRAVSAMSDTRSLR